MNPLVAASRRLVIGHRGASGSAPENTVPAFELALEQGADALELDVRITADGTPVVIHDATLDRTTAGAGPVAERRLDELRAVDAGARFSPDGGRSFPWCGRDVHIPTLAEVLERFPSTPVIVEVKDARAAAPARAVIDEAQAAGRCVIGSFDALALAPFRRGSYCVAGSRGEVARLLVPSLLGWAPRRVPYEALTIPRRYRGLPVVTRSLLRVARRLGCPVHVWTVNEPTVARRLWEQGVSGIITDVPAEMVGVRRDLGDDAGW